MKLTKAQREKLRFKFGGKCAYCGSPLTDRFHADHVVPVIRNLDGTMEQPAMDVIENLYPACARCNNYKHSMSVDQFRQSIRNALDNRLKNAGFHLLMRFGILTVNPIPDHIPFWFETYKREAQ